MLLLMDEKQTLLGNHLLHDLSTNVLGTKLIAECSIE